MEQKKKNTILMLLIVAAMVLLIVLIIYACMCCSGTSENGETVVTQPSTSEATTQTTEPSTTVPPTTAPTVETTNPTETTAPEETTAETKPEKVPPTEPTETEATEPPVTDPDEILAIARAQLKSLSGNSKEVSSVSNPKYVTIRVSDTENVQAAAQVIVNQVKGTLAYEQSLADPNVAVGNPKPFTYDYKLAFVSTENGQHTFSFAYHFTSTSYEVSSQSYDTNRLVADVCAYLSGMGKVKYDSHSSENAASQAVIVLMEHSYETALSIVKAQVSSASAQYSNFDFYYVGLTVTTKGGVEQQALLFYIVNK